MKTKIEHKDIYNQPLRNRDVDSVIYVKPLGEPFCDWEECNESEATHTATLGIYDDVWLNEL